VPREGRAILNWDSFEQRRSALNQSERGVQTAGVVRDSDRAYQVLKSLIITAELKPGEVMNEKLLAGQIKIGRTPVREAIQRLGAEGLIQILPRRGILISNIGVHDMHDILEMRWELERIAAAWAAERGEDSDFEAMGEILTKGAEAFGTQYYALFDLAFHKAIGKAAKNSQLESLIAHFHQLTLRLLYLNRTSQDILNGLHAQHRGILDVIRARDSNLAQVLITRHIDEVRTVLFGGPQGTIRVSVQRGG
jgi:DNA-binding GntR family transcriptional regulator